MRRLLYIVSCLFLFHELLPHEAGVPGNFYSITGSTVNIRTEPDLKSKKTGELKRGDQVQFIEDIHNGQQSYDTFDNILAPWVKIRTKEGKEGWIFGGYLSNPGEQAPVLGIKCLDFSVTPLKSFKGGGIRRYLGSGNPAFDDICEMQLNQDGSFQICTSFRSKSEGTWKVKGDSILIQIKKWSWEDLWNGSGECTWEAPLDPECLRAQKKKYGKQDFYIWGKVTLSFDAKKKKFQANSMLSYDPAPVVGKEIFKSDDWGQIADIMNKSCIVSYSD